MSLHSFVDSSGLLHVGSRQRNSNSTYESRHPVNGKHPLTRLHLRLLNVGPTLLSISAIPYHTMSFVLSLGNVSPVRLKAAKPPSQMLGQLSIKRITPGSVFDMVGVAYAGQPSMVMCVSQPL